MELHAMDQLLTTRLQLDKISIQDAPFYYELLNSEDWLRYIGDRKIRTVSDAAAYIEKNYLPSFETHGYGSFTVRLREDDTPIGSCGLYKREQLQHPDIGFAFLGEYTGKGYGYESASAVMEYATTRLGIATFLGVTVEYNKPSIALLEKLGLERAGTFRFEEDSEELLLFSTDA
ncbi:MAG: GNAT family N-acetyltransferase [Bacteroidota bacterium]